MKILLWANYQQYDKALGMSKKINDHIQVLRKMGNEVYYTAFTNEGMAVYDNNDKIIFTRNYLCKNKKYIRYARVFHLIKSTREYLDSSCLFDLAFVRWCGLSNGYIQMLKKMRNKCRNIVMDAHSYFPGQKPAGTIGRYITYTTKLNAKKIEKLHLLDLVLSESDEEIVFGTPAQKYDNGVDVSAISEHRYEGKVDDINLLAVGNEQIYHGYDRVIKGIKAYKGSRKILFHIVGVVSENTKKLVKDLSLENVVIFYGKQYGEKLDKIYNLCNVAVGPVGQHRIGGKQGTGLKTKEYFAKGIPYFYSGNELIVPADYRYCLKVSGDESALDLQAVIDFYDTIRNDDITTNMRQFAIQHFSWERIFQDMFDRIDRGANS